MSIAQRYAQLELTDAQWQREARTISNEAKLSAKYAQTEKQRRTFTEFEKDLKECFLCQPYIVAFYEAKEKQWRKAGVHG